MATTQEVFNLITKRMNQRASITNAATTQRRPASRFKTKAVEAPSGLEELAMMIEQSSLTIQEIAKRSRVEQSKIESFLKGDPDALDDAEIAQIRQVVEVVEQMESTAATARGEHTASRKRRGSF